MKVTADSKGAAQVVADLWELTGLRPETLERLQLTGDKPLLPTSFHVAVAAQSSIASAALAASEIGVLRSQRPQQVSVDMHDAEYECTGYFSIDGHVTDPWAPLSGLYSCQNGHVRIHANFDHHRDGVLRLLGLSGDPQEITKTDVERALSGWEAIAFETAAASAGMVVSAARSFETWDKTPQGLAIKAEPLFTIEKIGNASPKPLALLNDGDKPLRDIRVLDLTRILAGPVCGRTLAAYGADVMLVNSPNLPNIGNIAETSRGKLSCLLDLNQPVDTAALLGLAADTHIFVQGYRPGGLAGRGFSPEALAQVNPGVVYVSLSAYGHVGPWSVRRGFDSLVQTATGFNHAEGQAAGSDEPRALPVQILDYASGFLMAFAAEAALLRQSQEGGSWHVRVSLAQTAQWLRSMGRVDGNFAANKLDFETRLETYDSGYGRLAAMPHAARLSGAGLRWDRPSVVPGTHEPFWP